MPGSRTPLGFQGRRCACGIPDRCGTSRWRGVCWWGPDFGTPGISWRSAPNTRVRPAPDYCSIRGTKPAGSHPECSPRPGGGSCSRARRSPAFPGVHAIREGGGPYSCPACDNVRIDDPLSPLQSHRSIRAQRVLGQKGDGRPDSAPADRDSADAAPADGTAAPGACAGPGAPRPAGSAGRHLRDDPHRRVRAVTAVQRHGDRACRGLRRGPQFRGAVGSPRDQRPRRLREREPAGGSGRRAGNRRDHRGDRHRD